MADKTGFFRSFGIGQVPFFDLWEIAQKEPCRFAWLGYR